VSLHPEEEAPVDRGGVVDPVPVADEATAEATQVEHLVPVSLFPKFLRSGFISFFGAAPMPDPHSLDCDTWAYDHFGGPS